MAVRVKTFLSEQELAAWMTIAGVSLSGIKGPFINSSGQPFLFFEDSTPPRVISSLSASSGVSYGEQVGAGTIEAMAWKTPVAAEVVGALTGLSFSGALANSYVIPGSVVLTDSGGTGPTMKDDGNGNLFEAGTTIKRGTVDYATKAVVVNYIFGKMGTGNLLANYSYSSLPDTSSVPPRCRLTNVSVKGAGANIGFTIYEDSSLATPVYMGTIPVAAGEGMLVLPDRVMSTINRRWHGSASLP